MRKNFTFIIFSLSFLLVHSQDFVQDIKGKVFDADSKTPLWGAAIFVMDSKPLIGCVTDSIGDFKLKNVPLGRHNIKLSFIGYEEVFIQNVLVSSGKDAVLNIQMTESITKVKEVQIIAKLDKDKAINSMATISARPFSIEEAQRFAGGLTDPSRMAQAFAGVSSTSNSNNEIVVRGNSPKGLLWRIEGIEIPNPNHFREDEGASGGGVCILSSNVISNSDFFTSAFPAEYGNALSGVFDLNLRKGNDEKKEYSIVASVVGTEVSLEGPFSKKQKSSYLVNYRYSTFSLLDKMGIKVSNENIIPKFQDVTMNLNFPTRKFGNTSIFAIYGNSSSGISSIKDSTLLLNKENRYEEFDKGAVWIGGITNHYLFPNKKTYLKTVISLMGEENNMTNDTMDFNFNNHRIYDENMNYQTYRASILLNHKFNSKNTIRTGLIFSNENYDLYSSGLDFETNQNQTIFDNQGSTNVLQAYSQWKFRINDKLNLNSGLHYLYFALNNHQSLEPRLGLVWQINSRQSLSTGIGLHSRIEPISVYLTQIPKFEGDLQQPNKNLGFSKAFHNVLGYDFAFTEDLHLKAEIYYQFLYDIPIVDSLNSNFSILNMRYGFVTVPLDNKGTGQNYGLDLTFEKYFTKGFYFLITGSLFDSKYTAGDQKLYNTAFNGNYIFNALGGKEFSLGKKSNSLLGVNARILYKGGMRYQEIDLAKSNFAGEVVYSSEGNFTKRSADYYNLDLGINLKRNREKFSWTISLDVQNVTNKNNLIGVKYNKYSGSIKYDYDLLILPVLSYRIDF